MSQPNPAVDAFISRAKKWQEELALLREIVLSCALTEELKWGKPTYTADGGNVVLLMPLKQTCALLFPKGSRARTRSRRARCGSGRPPRSPGTRPCSSAT